ncbi:hypothetical protein GDO86_002463 [Hymenochirus boettgeri]|uniref:Complement component C9 n=1 Tax=Hymenochirus boettgeri TaxID=247094 RepID=A0A8T2KGZ6_9PIPI|nr:hypothetical protein GDO86_002463 [Hymenochirus boettgeri]
MSPWGSWTECDPCSKSRYRSRSIENFGQYGGKPCSSSLGDSQSCKPDGPCEEETAECGNDFQCESGRCIKTRFLCNGDNDCGDYSDETCDDGKDPKPTCRNVEIEVSEIARTAGDGLNVLGMNTGRNPFDNEYYNGLCDRVRDGNTRTYFRKPWNVAALVYQTKADKHFTTEEYKDATTIISKVIEGVTGGADLSLSLKTKPTERRNTTIDASAGIGFKKEESLQKLRTYSESKNKIFMKVSSSVQLASFQMRTRGAMLSNVFIDDINAMTPEYDKGEYFSLLEMYGTHYTSSGSLGGKYELVYVLDEALMNSKEVTTKDVKDCLNLNAGVNVDAGAINVNPSAKGDKCTTGGFEKDTDPNKEQKAVVEDIVSLIEGGTVEFNTALKEKLSLKNPSADVNDYVQWASSLKDSPVVIKHKPTPIYTLIPNELKDSYLKKRNIERAIEEYLDEYSVCKCQPCQNGGTVMVVNGECICKCPLQFEGGACQNLKSDQFEKPTVFVNGGWGCWTVISECVNEELKLKRECNNPTPQPGGKPCSGDAIKTIPCMKTEKHDQNHHRSPPPPTFKHGN